MHTINCNFYKLETDKNRTKIQETRKVESINLLVRIQNPVLYEVVSKRIKNSNCAFKKECFNDCVHLNLRGSNPDEKMTFILSSINDDSLIHHFPKNMYDLTGFIRRIILMGVQEWETEEDLVMDFSAYFYSILKNYQTVDCQMTYGGFEKQKDMYCLENRKLLYNIEEKR